MHTILSHESAGHDVRSHYGRLGLTGQEEYIRQYWLETYSHIGAQHLAAVIDISKNGCLFLCIQQQWLSYRRTSQGDTTLFERTVYNNRVVRATTIRQRSEKWESV